MSTLILHPMPTHTIGRITEKPTDKLFTYEEFKSLMTDEEFEKYRVNMIKFSSDATAENFDDYMIDFIARSNADKSTGGFDTPFQKLIFRSFPFSKTSEGLDYWGDLGKRKTPPPPTKRHAFYFRPYFTAKEWGQLCTNILKVRGAEEYVRLMNATEYESHQQLVRKSFEWDKTPEGHEYWIEIAKRTYKPEPESVII